MDEDMRLRRHDCRRAGEDKADDYDFWNSVTVSQATCCKALAVAGFMSVSMGSAPPTGD